MGEKEERAIGGRVPSTLARGKFGGESKKIIKSGKPPKHERLGISEKHMHQAEAIHRHPEGLGSWYPMKDMEVKEKKGKSKVWT
jgi:hypothetical protein